MKAHYARRFFFPVLILGILLSLNCGRKLQQQKAFVELKDIESPEPIPLNGWKFHLDDVAGAENPALDDAEWQTVHPNYTWGVNPICWFRKEVVIPEEMAGKAVILNVIIDDKGIIYVDGRKHHSFNWYGKAFLTPKASAGEKFLVGIKGLNGLGSGHIVSAELVTAPNTLRYEIDEKMEYLKPLNQAHQVQVNGWSYRFGEIVDAADPNFDDSKWELVDVGNRWEVEHSSCWLRKLIVLPEKVNGFDITGSVVSFSVSIDDAAEIYLNGKLVQNTGSRSSGVILTQNAKPGDSFFLAIKGINVERSGILLDARLTYSKLQPLAEQGVAYLKEISGLNMLLDRIPNPDPQWGKSITESLADALNWPSASGLEACQKLLADAEKVLAPVKMAANEYPIQIKGPYLQNVTQSSMTIMWETDTPSDSRVVFGKSGEPDQSAYSAEKVRIHEVKLADLQPQTKYHYRAISGELSSTQNTFHTAINKNTPFRFVIWGDSHTNAPQFEKNINRMIQYKPDFAVSVGDMVLTGSEYDLWGHEFFIPARNLFKNTPLFTTLGNHEYGGYGAGNPVVWFEKFFSQPGKEYYYSYDYGNSHFIHLNPHTNSPFGVLPGSEQYQWLIADLESDASKNAAWRFVFFHEPPMGEPLMAEHIVPLLEKYKATMQFSGHFHTYLRHQKDKPDGTYYIITGGGGGSLSDLSRMKAREREGERPDFYKAVHHFSLLDIDGGHLTFRAVDIDGNVFDSFEIRK